MKRYLRATCLALLAFFILSNFITFLPSITHAQNPAGMGNVGGTRPPEGANFAPNGITIKTQTFTSQQGSYREDNLIRVVKGQTLNFRVVLTVTQLQAKNTSSPSSILLGSDTLDIETTTFGRRTLLTFGTGLEVTGEGNKCNTKNLTGLSPLEGKAVIMYCEFQGLGTYQEINSGRIELNNSKTFSFSLPSNLQQNLKLNPDSTSAQRFTVYPYFGLQIALGPDRNMVVDSAAKDIYVKYYPTEQALQTAIANNDRAGVPGYGTREGSTAVGGTGNLLIALINKIIGFVIGLIQEFIYLVFSFAIAPMIQAMLSIRTYTDTFAAVIYPGWQVVRNLCNIIFIVALIAIAMGTLFRIESYKFRELLVQLIIAALLVNFSLVIAQVVLGVADTVQNQFLPNNVEVIRALAKDLMVGYRKVIYNMDFAGQGEFSYTIQPLFHLALSLGSFMVFLAIAAFLFIRIVMLWILLMISPVAYAVGVIPATKHYRSEWWKNFLKYAFFTPIMAFFLNMTAVISNTFHQNPLFKEITGVNEADLGGSSVAVFVFKVASNILLLVFLLVALKVAEQAGIYGASAISGFAKKGMMAPFALAGKGIKAGTTFGLEKVHEKTGIQLNPQKWIEGWKESREISKKRREAAGMAKAEGRSVLANPASFFQRYWSPASMWRAVSRGNIKGKKLQQEAVELFEKSKAKRREGNDAEADRLMELARTREAQALKKLFPVDYLTQQKVRHGVHEEKGNVHAETWEELVSYANGALREQNLTRYLAVAQKLSETYNENELVTHTYYPRAVKAKECAEWEEMETAARKDGKTKEEIAKMGEEILHDTGDTFDSSREGMRNFSKFVFQEKFGLSKVASRNYLADITDIAEHQGHWGIARIIGNEAGMPVEKTGEESEEEAEAEKGKIEVGQKYTRWNRLAHCDELTATDYMTSGVRFPILQGSSANDIVKNIQNIKFMLGRGYLGVSNARAFSFSANLARLQERADQIDPNRKMDLLDRGGNVMTYQKDVEAGSKESLDGLPHKAGERMEVIVKKYVEGVIEDMKQQAGEHWGKDKIEMYKSEQALLGRVNAGKMPPKYMKSLTKVTSRGYAYLEPTGAVDNGKVQYRINPNWSTPPPAPGTPPATGTPTPAPAAGGPTPTPAPSSFFG